MTVELETAFLWKWHSEHGAPAGKTGRVSLHHGNQQRHGTNLTHGTPLAYIGYGTQKLFRISSNTGLLLHGNQRIPQYGAKILNRMVQFRKTSTCYQHIFDFHQRDQLDFLALRHRRGQNRHIQVAVFQHLCGGRRRCVGDLKRGVGVFLLEPLQKGGKQKGQGQF